jgi:hypothetical protein
VGWAVRNCFQVGPDRRGAGSIPAAFKIFHTVDVATGRLVEIEHYLRRWAAGEASVPRVCAADIGAVRRPLERVDLLFGDG